jgi:uncharacterized RDD family membrane protein YckC|tara:strand:- start:264 stop:746 length:483 start_codon:yes stop_codon:yes gene_type:complete
MMGSDELCLASRFRRFVATLIDAILVPSMTLVLVMVTGVVEDAEDFSDSWWVLWVFLLAVTSYLSLNGYSLWRRGQTLGKLVTGIAVVAAVDSGDSRYTRTPAPLWRLVCIRALFFPLLFVVVIPWLAPLPIIDQLFIFGKRRRCLHDLVSGTVVVRLSK